MKGKMMCLVILALMLALALALYQPRGCVWDFAMIHTARCDVVKIHSTQQLISVLNENIALEQPRRLCVAGSKYSHGGHTMAEGAMQLDLASMNRVQLVGGGHVEVEAGATWKHVLTYLDQHDRSIVEMQSYWNFSVGGSVSVNCHGRGMTHGSVADTIQHMDVVVHQGSAYSVLRVYPQDELFKAVVGGYGAVGIIVSVTLLSTANVPIVKFTDKSSVVNYVQTLQRIMDRNPVMYNAEIYPGDYYNIKHIYWLPGVGNPTTTARLQSHDGWAAKVPMLGAQLLKTSNALKQLRACYAHNTNDQGASVWLNHEMSHDVGGLEPITKQFTTYILQEYFIPVEHIQKFIPEMTQVFEHHNVNVLNISLRCVKPTDRVMLNYTTPSLTIAVVLYINIWNSNYGINQLRLWTMSLIDTAASFGGRYYLPYLPLASRRQFELMYPEVHRLRAVKAQYDPKCLLRSHFIDKYIVPVE